MNFSTVSSRALNQDISRAKKAALNGPVFITDRGKPAHVLLSMADYQRLVKQGRSIAEALALPDGVDIAFTPERVSLAVQTPDLS